MSLLDLEKSFIDFIIECKALFTMLSVTVTGVTIAQLFLLT